MTDGALLKRYAETGDQDAFAELVRRHLGLVFGAALRRTNQNAALAEEVAQHVFATMARDACRIKATTLAGWLYVATRHAAANTMRAERRRLERETEAYAMDDIHRSSEEAAPDWAQIRGVIDSVVDELSPADREAVLLRYFKSQPFEEIGRSLAVSEDAARVRVNRALEKLHALLAKRGVTSTAAALGGLLTSQAAGAVPAGMAASITGAALATGSYGGAATGFIFMKIYTKAALWLVVVLLGFFALRTERRNREMQADLRRLEAEIGRLRSATVSAGFGGATEGGADTGRNPGREESQISSVAGARAGSDALRPREMWKNVGRATPAEAYETAMWASDRGELDVLAASFVLNDEQGREVEALFQRLPPSDRAKYVSPQKMIALLFASGTPAALQVISQTEQSANEALLTARVQNNAGRVSELQLTFRRYPDGWRVVVPDWLMKKSMAKLR